MRFLYNIEEREGVEYVVLKVIENGLEGKGCVVPERRRGENYKVIMGAIEEYRKEVEKASIQDIYVLPEKLEMSFPNHPKVIFAITMAMVELFSKMNDFPIEKLFPKIFTPEEIDGGIVDEGAVICNGERYPLLEDMKCLSLYDKIAVQLEYIGNPFRAYHILRSLTDLGLDILGVFRNYPGDEMKEAMEVLKGLFKKYVVLSW